MFCYNCGSEMVCKDDFSLPSRSYDYLECEECGSQATIETDNFTHKIIRVEWRKKDEFNIK